MLAEEVDMPEILRSTLVVAREKMMSYSDEGRFGKKFLGTIEPAEPLDKSEIEGLIQKVLGVGSTQENFWENVNKLALSPMESIGEYNKHRVAYFLRDQACLAPNVPENTQIISKSVEILEN